MINTVDERFWEKVKKDEGSGCLVWVGAKNPPKAGEYGRFRVGDKIEYAHRWSYRALKGRIPKDLEIDHLCKNTLCVNPKHLEAVTQKENIRRSDCPPAINARKKVCLKGHRYDKQNTYVLRSGPRKGHRQCRECKRLVDLKYTAMGRRRQAYRLSGHRGGRGLGSAS